MHYTINIVLSHDDIYFQTYIFTGQGFIEEAAIQKSHEKYIYNIFITFALLLPDREKGNNDKLIPIGFGNNNCNSHFPFHF